MGFTGKIVTRMSGKRGLRSSGKAATFNALGVCGSCCSQRYFTVCLLTFTNCGYQAPTSQYLGMHFIGESVLIDGTTIVLPAGNTGWAQYFNNGATSFTKLIKYYRFVVDLTEPSPDADRCAELPLVNPAYPTDPRLTYVVNEFDACGGGLRTNVRYCDVDEFGCYSIGLMVYGAIAADLSGLFTSAIAGPPRRCLPPGTPRSRVWRLRETGSNHT
jgi:hypothetical protein